MPCHLWTMTCVSLYNDNGIAVEEGIGHSIKSNLIVKNTRPLGDTQIAVRISKSLKLDEFQTSGSTWPITHVFL
jgi:hypothetical protein